MNLLTLLKQRFRAALAQMVDNPDAYLDMIRAAQDAKFGDYQANCAMPLGKQLGRSPRDVAADLISHVQLQDLCHSPEIAGPGFINLRLKDQWLIARLTAALADDRLGIATVESPRTYIVDYSSPNIAKPMHVGHIRSTVIGDALAKVLRFLGHHVITDNHLGDWGTQFGMIIYGYRHFLNKEAFASQPVDELGRIYRQVRQIMDIVQAQKSLPELEARLAKLQAACAALKNEPLPAEKSAAKTHRKRIQLAESDLQRTQQEIASTQEKLAAVQADSSLQQLVDQHPDIAQAALQETAKLHAGDSPNRALWEQFLPPCKSDIDGIYRRLDIQFDHELGESFYHPMLPDTVAHLQKSGLARESEGALCVFLDDFDAPMIVRKKDGAFLYATTDLATIKYRVETWDPDVVLYVVDFRQGDHFAKLFATAALCGYDKLHLEHVSFGTVLGDDGKPFKTRSGDTVGLKGLLDEAERRAYEVVCAGDAAKPNGSELDETARRHIARVVGIAALKYADLSQNRTSDYTFSYDKMLSLNGNTATYMQYSYARIHGIFARGDVDPRSLDARSMPLSLGHPAERALGLELLRVADALDEVAGDFRPNHLTSYLFDLAKAFSTFFEQCPVLKAENDHQRHSRLLLCLLTARTLQLGLSLLGIQVVDKM